MVLDPKSDRTFELGVVVPDQHLVKTLDLSQIELDPRGSLGSRSGQPHIGRIGRVLTVDEARTVNRILGAGAFFGAPTQPF